MAKSINAILGVLAAVLLVPVASYAAGLGTITVRSALGQPLDAEIEVVALQPGEDIQVRLATREAYQNAGIDLSPMLQGARFAVERRDGRTIVRVRTSQPVNDPFFSVLVELQTPTGRLSRQYTVLVDPAEYKIASTPAPPQAAAAASPATVAPAPAAAPPRAQAQPPKIAASKAPTPAPTAPPPVVVAPPAPVAATSTPAQAPSPVVVVAPAPASASVPSVTQSIARPSAAPAAARPIEATRELSPAPAVAAQPVAAQPIVVAQPTTVPTPAPAASETSRPAVVAAQPTPAPVQTPAVVAAPVLADASTTPPAKPAEPVATTPSVESAPVLSAATSTPPAPAPVQPAVAAAPSAPAQPVAAPVSRSPTPQAAIPTTPALQAASQPTVAPARVAQVAVPTAPSTPVAAPMQQNTEVSDAYRIRRGDTLGAIARKWKPDGVSHEQMLVGLYQTNRPAFIRANINLIRAGATLFIPSRDDVLAINAADAARQVRTHMAAFTKYRDTTVSAGTGSGKNSQAQREVISRRVGVKKSSTRAM